MPKVRVTQKRKQNDKLHPVQDSGSLAVFKVTARDQGHYKGPLGAFVTYCNISCLFYFRAVDIWAVGCLLIEMLTGEPLFPGDSDIDQLYHIVKVFGKSEL